MLQWQDSGCDQGRLLTGQWAARACLQLVQGVGELTAWGGGGLWAGQGLIHLLGGGGLSRTPQIASCKLPTGCKLKHKLATSGIFYLIIFELWLTTGN